jgi:hypothetical protein
MKSFKIISAVALLSSAMVVSNAYAGNDREKGRGTGPTVFVTSQGLYYDSIVVADPLPKKGNFQQLVPDENGLHTEFGPGDVGHLGGRWWIDKNADGVMDSGDKYFLCPLLGPGRETL